MSVCQGSAPLRSPLPRTGTIFHMDHISFSPSSPLQALSACIPKERGRPGPFLSPLSVPLFVLSDRRRLTRLLLIAHSFRALHHKCQCAKVQWLTAPRTKYWPSTRSRSLFRLLLRPSVPPFWRVIIQRHICRNSSWHLTRLGTSSATLRPTISPGIISSVCPSAFPYLDKPIPGMFTLRCEVCNIGNGRRLRRLQRTY